MLFACAGVTACNIIPPDRLPEERNHLALECRFIFDAGSSGTRLFAYVQQADGSWLEKAGPRTAALADPLREIRGKRRSDTEDVLDDLVRSLDRFTTDGPTDDKGRNTWRAFDWPKHCRVLEVAVLGTAGMRLAEQMAPDASRIMWQRLADKLRVRMPSATISARTLTGFEEGLFAWMAVRAQRSDAQFGMVEMGGASAQVSFPCPNCSVDDDAVQMVRLDGRAVRMYSHSFLGLGQDEAPKVLGMPSSCAHGVGAKELGWQRGDCASRLTLHEQGQLRDPYNLGARIVPDTGRLGYRAVPIAKAEVKHWVLTGALNHMQADAVAQCCQSEGACFDAPRSCFRAVYLEEVLAALGVAADSPKLDVSWTAGAALCAATRCLEPAGRLQCHWSVKGCLADLP